MLKLTWGSNSKGCCSEGTLGQEHKWAGEIMEEGRRQYCVEKGMKWGGFVRDWINQGFLEK